MNEKVYLYKLNNELISEEKLISAVPRCRLEKAEKLKVESARYESLVAGRLMVIALADYLGVTENQIIAEIDKFSTVSEASKKVYPLKFRNVYYNISHSKQYIAVAIAETAVGVDVEGKDDKDFKVTRRMFCAEDQLYVIGETSEAENNSNVMLDIPVDGESDTLAQARFRDVWTEKESFLKCTGQGISVPLKSFMTDKNDGAVISKGYDMNGRQFYNKTERLDGDDYSISICSENPNLILDTIRVEVLI